MSQTSERNHEKWQTCEKKWQSSEKTDKLFKKCDKKSQTSLNVIIMLRTRLRVNLHPTVAWMSRNFLLEAGVISKV